MCISQVMPALALASNLLEQNGPVAVPIYLVVVEEQVPALHFQLERTGGAQIVFMWKKTLRCTSIPTSIRKYLVKYSTILNANQLGDSLS